MNILKVNFEEKYTNLTAKVLEALKYVHKNALGEFDWLLKADDDTYVIMENLKSFLANRCSNDNHTYGFNFNNGELYHSGGGGYLVSRETVRALGNALESNASFCSMSQGYEDLEVAGCLHKLNVTLGESRDEMGRERFHGISLKDHWEGNKKWIEGYAFHKPKYV